MLGWIKTHLYIRQMFHPFFDKYDIQYLSNSTKIVANTETSPVRYAIFLSDMIFIDIDVLQNLLKEAVGN